MKPVIMCPAHGRIEPDVSEMFTQLRFVHGWDYQAWHGGLGVDRVRSQMASYALRGPNEWIFWCDDDNFLPTPQAIELWETAKSENLDVLCAVIPTRRMKIVPNFVPLESDKPIIMGPDGGLVKAARAGLALAFTHRRVFEALIALEQQKMAEAEKHQASIVDLLELCPKALALSDAHIEALKFALANWYQPDLAEVDYTTAFVEETFPGRPFFHPIIDAQERQHLGEDYSICQRIRAAGMDIWVDTRKVGIHLADNQARTLMSIQKQYAIFERQEEDRLYREAVVF